MIISDKQLIEVHVALLNAALEIDNLRPHVGDAQLAAAQKIQAHIATVAKILAYDDKNKETKND